MVSSGIPCECGCGCILTNNGTIRCAEHKGDDEKVPQEVKDQLRKALSDRQESLNV